MCNTYNDLSPARCCASDITQSELTAVVILEIRVGKLRKLKQQRQSTGRKQNNIQPVF